MSDAGLRELTISIVRIVTPDDAFVVEDGYDDLVANWNSARSQNEGRFIGGVEVATFAALAVPFLATFFGDIAKDVAKDVIKNELSAFVQNFLNHRPNTGGDGRVKIEIRKAIEGSRFSKEQKKELRSGFEKLFAKVDASK